ncbi:PAS domain-containing protein [bacterium]|nr:PAS domain-containing protein [bacterium]
MFDKTSTENTAGTVTSTTTIDVGNYFRSKIRWLLIARFGMFVFITGAVLIVFSGKGLLSTLLFAYGLITLGYLLTLVYWEKSRKELSFKFICGVQLFFELLVEIGIVHYSGGAGSPFILLFGLSVITSAFIFKLIGTLVTATGSVLLLTTMVIMEHRGVIEPVIDRFPVTAMLYTDVDLLFFTTYIYALFIYLVAFMMGYISGKLQVRTGELQVTGEALRRISMDTDDILMHMLSGLITLDPEGRVVYLNKAASALLDIDSKKIKGKFLDEILPSHAKVFTEVLSELLGEGSLSERKGEFLLKTGDEFRTMHLTCSFLNNPEGSLRGIIALFEDVTEQKRREIYLKEVEKMAAIGELSANLAHEIRNPLASIRGSVETIMGSESVIEDDSERRLMNLIIKETDRLTNVLEEFLVFARLKELPIDHITYNRIDLAKLISEIVLMLKHTPGFADYIEINNKLKGEVWTLGREEQLKDAFYNLIINAKDAIGENKGTITIKITKERLGFYAEKRLIGVSVSDTGPGIPEELLSRVFTPFFSTKPRGTGLGLAIAQGIVNRHRGIIEANNLETGGARLTVYLLKAPSQKENLFDINKTLLS